jgi:phage baseplate assembly protein V
MTAVSRSRSTDRRYYGVAEALVVDVNDPDKEGRIKLRFPWFDEHMISEWCRVCQFYAGNGYGAFYVPEVGDEVVVAFVHGDMRLPIVLGGMYNGADKPVTHRADAKDEKVLRTKAGHQIMLIDTQGEETIRIIAKGDKNSIEISTKENAITVKSATGKIVVQGKEIEIKAQASMTLEAGGDMKLKGQTIHLN